MVRAGCRSRRAKSRLVFARTDNAEEFEDAAQSGEIEQLLDWRKVKAGDVIFVPAGTVHAIGAGLTICEIQENSDITYRLYDYGRPRELHLDHGVAVSHLTADTDSEPKPITLSRLARSVARVRDISVSNGCGRRILAD